MEKLSILIVDDEVEITNLIEVYLINEGYRVYKAHNAHDAFDILNKYEVHMVVLDVMMPGIDGLEACRQIRRDRNIPILMLSAKSEDMDKIMGLCTGADDYMTKPFNPLELIARIKSQLRRYLFLNTSGINPTVKDVIELEGLSINTARRSVSVYGNETSLTPREYDVLLLLVKNRGKVLRAWEIYEKVWDEQILDSKNSVMVHIRRIREKIEEDPRNPKFIKTIWGVGYIIEN